MVQDVSLRDELSLGGLPSSSLPSGSADGPLVIPPQLSHALMSLSLKAGVISITSTVSLGSVV